MTLALGTSWPEYLFHALEGPGGDRKGDTKRFTAPFAIIQGLYILLFFFFFFFLLLLLLFLLLLLLLFFFFFFLLLLLLLLFIYTINKTITLFQATASLRWPCLWRVVQD